MTVSCKSDMTLGRLVSRRNTVQWVRRNLFTTRCRITCSISSVNYLLSYRLQWGKHDTLSKLSSRLGPPAPHSHTKSARHEPTLPSVPEGAPNYFTADINPELISILQNDWPYSGVFLYCVLRHYYKRIPQSRRMSNTPLSGPLFR